MGSGLRLCCSANFQFSECVARTGFWLLASGFPARYGNMWPAEGSCCTVFCPFSWREHLPYLGGSLMQAQNLAGCGAGLHGLAALVSQRLPALSLGCETCGFSAMISRGCQSAAFELRSSQSRAYPGIGNKAKIRRQKCPRASNFSRWQVCWRVSQPAAANKKNLSWSSPNPFRSSPLTPANTSNNHRGPALWPAPVAAQDAGSRASSC